MREGWAETNVAACTVMIKRGKAPAYVESGGIAVLNQKCIRPGNVLDFAPMRRTSPVRDTPSELFLRDGDVVVCSTGRGTLGRASGVGWLTEPVTVDSHVTVVRAAASVVLGHYLALVLSSRFSELESLGGGSTNQTELSAAGIGSLRLALPPVSEQRRIVDLIGALDNTIAASAEAAAHRLYGSALRTLDDSYPAVPIGDVVSSAFAGGTPSRAEPEYFTGKIPWLKSGEVESDSIAETIEHISERGLRSSAARLVPAGSTVVAMYGQGDTKGRAGFVVSPVTTNQAVLALVPDARRIDAKYLLHAVRSRTESLRRRAVGAAQPNLSKGLVLTELIPVPAELEEQIQWREMLDSLRAAGSSQRATGDRLRQARAEMLAALLSGEHEIPELYDELMEVAS